MEKSFENYLAHSDGAASLLSSRANSRYGDAHLHGGHGAHGGHGGHGGSPEYAADLGSSGSPHAGMDALMSASPGGAPLGSWDGYMDHLGLGDDGDLGGSDLDEVIGAVDTDEDSLGIYTTARAKSLGMGIAPQGDAAYDFDLDLSKPNKDADKKKKAKKKKKLKRDKEYERADRERRERQRRLSTEERMQDLLGEVKQDFARERMVKEAEAEALAKKKAAQEQEKAAAAAAAADRARQEKDTEAGVRDDDDLLSDSLEMSSADFQVGGYLSRSAKDAVANVELGSKSEIEHKDYSVDSADEGAPDKGVRGESAQKEDAPDDNQEVSAHDAVKALRDKLSEHMNTGVLPENLAKEISFGDLSQLMQASHEESEEDEMGNAQMEPTSKLSSGFENDFENTDRDTAELHNDDAQAAADQIYRSFEEHAKDDDDDPDDDDDDDNDDEAYESAEFDAESPRGEPNPRSDADETPSHQEQKSSENDSAALESGSRIRARLFDWNQYYEGRVSKVRGDGLVDISFDDGEHVDGVDPSDIQVIDSFPRQEQSVFEGDRANDVNDEQDIEGTATIDDVPKQSTEKAVFEAGDEGAAESRSDAPQIKATSSSSHVQRSNEGDGFAQVEETDDEEVSFSGDAPVARPETPPSPSQSPSPSPSQAIQEGQVNSGDEQGTPESDEDQKISFAGESEASVAQDAASGVRPVEETQKKSRADELKAMFWDPIASQHSSAPPSPPQSPTPPPPPSSPPSHFNATGSLLQCDGSLQHQVHELRLELAASKEALHETERALAQSKMRERELSTTVDAQKAEIFGLHAELKDTRSTNAVRGSLRSILRESTENTLPREELMRIEREMAEQDRLLIGYQKENEKLVAQLDKAEARAEEVRESLYRANMRATRDLNSQSGVEQGHNDVGADLRRRLAADEKIRALEEEVEDLKRRLASRRRAEEKTASLASSEPHTSNEESPRELIQELRKELAEARFEHLREAKALKEKLAWYVENQQLLEEHAAVIEEQRERIRVLETGKENDASSKSSVALVPVSASSRRPKQSLPSDLKRIRTLEKQVRELEEALRKRNPDCIANLILAAGPTDAEKETRRELREQVAALKEELESKAKMHASRMRSLRQEHERVKVRYERLLDEKRGSEGRPSSSSSTGAPSPSKHSHMPSHHQDAHQDNPSGTPSLSGEARIQQLEQELVRVREFYRKKIEDLSKKSSTALRAARREGPVPPATASAQRDLDRLRAAKTALEARVEDLEAVLSTDKSRRALASLEARLSSAQEENASLKATLEHFHGQSRAQQEESPEDPATDHPRPELDDGNDVRPPRDTGMSDEDANDVASDGDNDVDEETSALVAFLREQKPAQRKPAAARTRGKVDDAKPQDQSLALRAKVQVLEAENARVAARWTAALERSEDAVRRLRLANEELEARLHEAKRQLDEPLTPSMVQQQALTRRLNDMEARFQARERELELIVHNVKHRAEMDLHAAQSRFDAALATKNAEIRHFRAELDALLSAAQSLA
ncbi:Centrosomal protein of 162 kDa [Hondaea fermentalgiana]|uniref:Centrosomal protein of 162 kDa n=1 Tax=Hondaea fermentalgiana TaxID=2315210 RepID=A0A2R5G744_9STRA|nr:Centrosomal protein of 162 kDa [Hondaea fermentalgiana]|eukprot:GBG23861.1 Centrosomal protein of 162 kDa [Hondaea fermentalgiana]